MVNIFILIEKRIHTSLSIFPLLHFHSRTIESKDMFRHKNSSIKDQHTPCMLYHIPSYVFILLGLKPFLFIPMLHNLAPLYDVMNSIDIISCYFDFINNYYKSFRSMECLYDFFCLWRMSYIVTWQGYPCPHYVVPANSISRTYSSHLDDQWYVFQ